VHLLLLGERFAGRPPSVLIRPCCRRPRAPG